MDRFSYEPGEDAMTDEELARLRHAARDSLFLVAQLRIDGGPEAQVRVRNLSAGGLMAELSEPLEIGTRVSVDVRGVGPTAGRIAWYAEGRAGIAFDYPIDPQKARKPVGTGKMNTGFVKPVIVRR